MRRASVVTFVAVAVGLAAAPGALAAPEGIHKIQHVVMMMQEDRWFVCYFGTCVGVNQGTRVGGENGVVLWGRIRAGRGVIQRPWGRSVLLRVWGRRARDGQRGGGYTERDVHGGHAHCPAWKPRETWTKPCILPSAWSKCDHRGLIQRSSVDSRP